jgi:hypothetical protein
LGPAKERKNGGPLEPHDHERRARGPSAHEEVAMTRGVQPRGVTRATPGATTWRAFGKIAAARSPRNAAELPNQHAREDEDRRLGGTGSKTPRAPRRAARIDALRMLS